MSWNNIPTLDYYVDFVLRYLEQFTAYLLNKPICWIWLGCFAIFCLLRLAPNAILSHPLARLTWCITGAAFGVSVVLTIVGDHSSAVFLASIGGSTVFLFGLTRAPAAQPRALIGGHIGGATIGIACYQAFGDDLWVYVLAQVLALVYMLTIRVVHPPAGANPLLMIHSHASWSALYSPVLIGIVSLMVVAIIWSRLYRGLVHYPVSPLEPSPPKMLWGGWD